MGPYEIFAYYFAYGYQNSRNILRAIDIYKSNLPILSRYDILQEKTQDLAFNMILD